MVARVYDRLIPRSDTGRLTRLLGLPVDGSLLDAGGGTGRVSVRLRPLVGQLVITDASRGMVNQARRNRGLNAVRAIVVRLPFADGRFDRILVVDALHHFGNAQQAIADFARVLKPGGRLVIEEPNIRRRGIRLLALAERAARMGSRFFDADQIVAMTHRVGLSARVVEPRSLIFWITADKLT